MTSDDEFRRRAAHAQEMSDRVSSPFDKEAWLKVAQGWLALIGKPRATAEQRFDAKAKARGTGQDDSESSH
jgi:hypothetical protein